MLDHPQIETTLTIDEWNASDVKDNIIQGKYDNKLGAANKYVSTFPAAAELVLLLFKVPLSSLADVPAALPVEVFT